MPGAAAALDRGRPNRYIAVMKSPDKTQGHRAARLAEALRENLRKRKGQARARRAGADAGADAPGEAGPGEAKAARRDGTDRSADEGN